MNGRFTRVAASIAVLALLLLTACSPSASPSASAGASPGGDGSGSTVEVTLQEWAVVPAETSAPAGEITFAVTNDGPDDVHEFVVIRTDLEPGDLPTDEHGAVDESGEGVEVIDEIEDIPVARPRKSPSSWKPGATSSCATSTPRTRTRRTTRRACASPSTSNSPTPVPIDCKGGGAGGP